MKNMKLSKKFNSMQMYIPISGASVNRYCEFSSNYRDIAYLILLYGSEREHLNSPRAIPCGDSYF